MIVPCFTAHFLTWIYVADDPEMSVGVLEKFHTDMRRVNVDRIEAWFPTAALIGKNQPADFVAAFQRSILRRPLDVALHPTLCDIPYHLAHHPRMHAILRAANISITTPVFWVVKAMQRYWCLYAGDALWDPEMALVAFGGLTYVDCHAVFA